MALLGSRYHMPQLRSPFLHIRAEHSQNPRHRTLISTRSPTRGFGNTDIPAVSPLHARFAYRHECSKLAIAKSRVPRPLPHPPQGCHFGRLLVARYRELRTLPCNVEHYPNHISRPPALNSECSCQAHAIECGRDRCRLYSQADWLVAVILTSSR